MKLQSKLAVVAGTMALGVFPAVAVGNGGHPNNSTPPTKASKAKAYGRFCQGESKSHVAGTPGTPFSKCVTDMAKLANGSATNPAKACANESKKHVAGHPGTPYSVCVSGGKKLLKQQAGG
jgi:hypothetical protein